MNIQNRRKRLFDEQDCKCIYCHEPMILKYSRSQRRNPKRASIEHVIPKSQGGTDAYRNMKCSCVSCNSTRGSIEHNKFIFMRKFSNWGNWLN